MIAFYIDKMLKQVWHDSSCLEFTEFPEILYITLLRNLNHLEDILKEKLKK